MPVLTAIYCDTLSPSTLIEQAAQQLNLPIINHVDFQAYGCLLQYQSSQWWLWHKEFKPITLDFLQGTHAARTRESPNRQILAKALGVKAHRTPSVIDATAGLGRDSWLLSNLHCKVYAIERNKILAFLFNDALQRALKVMPTLQLQIFSGEAIKVIPTLPATEVIYLDPMFPERRRQSLVKKEMRILRDLVGEDEDSLALAEFALNTTAHRLVIKRAKLDPPLPLSRKPSLCFEGNSVRFDVYFR